MKRLFLLAAVAASLVSVVTWADFPEDATPSQLSQVSLNDLRITYLVCDRLSAQAGLDANTGTSCARVSKALLKRGFGGDVNDLLHWRADARSSDFASRKRLAWKTLTLAGREPPDAAALELPASVAFGR